MLSGTEDTVVSMDAIQEWVQTVALASEAKVQLRFVQGARHELFSEIAAYYHLALDAARRWFSKNSSGFFD